MSGSQLQVRLYRDSFNTPWGFRLQGGKDLGQPLSIQRVFSNSPAEGELQRGDLILAISNRNGNELTHKQALDLIKHGGGQIQLVIQRPAPGRVVSSTTTTTIIKPQRPRAPTLQQPPTSPHHTMPASQISYGFQPKKVTLSSLGGGGPCFGSDFTSSRAPVTQPVHVHTGGRGSGADMLNRVQTSLDNISLSPRTPDYGYQAAPFSTSPVAPSGGYIPTGVRLDMEREREEELRRQQQQQQYQPPPPQQYHYEPPQQHFTPQPAYVPTGIRLEQQMGETADEPDAVPVWERRRTFMNAPSKPAAPPTGKMNAPKVPRPKSGQGPFTGFGVDYSKPAPKTSSVTWRPSRPAQTPVNAPQVQMAPAPWQQQQQQQQGDQPDAPPAWRHTLKTTGVKPWDSDLQYTAQQEAPSGGGAPAQNPPKEGDRDWTQSAVYRMIYEEEHRGPRGVPQQQQQHHHQQQQQQQQQRAPPPPPKPKPQSQFQQSFPAMDEEFGTSDF